MSNFWEQQAKKYGSDVKAVNFDPVSEELEVGIIKKMIGENEVVCDLGCGNGLTLLEIAKDREKSTFYGMDFIADMISSANQLKEKAGLNNLSFSQADASSEALADDIGIKFDKVITKRLLINLKGDKKYNAIKSIYNMLKPGGTYIMVECFLEPLQAINEIRGLLDLEEIKVKDFNEYLSLETMQKVEELFSIEEKIDFQSLYYFISRVFNAFLSDGNPSYDAEINMLAADLIKKGVNPVSGYSPEVIYVLKKKG